MVQELTEQNFDVEVLKSDVPVLVDFSATWCGPCKAIAPIVDQLATTYAGKFKVVKLDVDDASSVAQQYGIRGVPTFFVFKNGKVVESIVGAPAKQKLVELLDKHT